MDLGCDFPGIPLCYFELAELEDVSAGKYPEEAIIDVIGRLCGFGSVEHVMANAADLRVRNMYIMNDRGSTLEISLWEDHVDQFDVVALATKSSTVPIIVGCSCLQVRKFIGVFGLKTIIASRFFVDVESATFSAFCSRLPADLPRMFVDGSDNFPRSSDLIPLPVTRAAAAKMSFECAVEIVNLNDRFGWFYLACPSCFRRVSESDDLVKCAK